MNNLAKISVVILTFNEEKNIERAILSAQQISDDIIVLDSFSTDNTKDICLKHKVNFIQHKWLGYGLQRNFAVEQAKYNWIFCLDADEEITKALANEIKTLHFDHKNEVFYIKRLNNYSGKWIKHGLWGRDKVLRIYNKETTKWDNKAVHENLKLNTSHQVNYLKNKLLHYSYANELELKQKTEKYAKLAAQNLLSKDKQANFFDVMCRPLFKFVINYIFRLGFLDGIAGFIIAKYQLKETQLKYKFLKKLNQIN